MTCHLPSDRPLVLARRNLVECLVSLGLREPVDRRTVPTIFAMTAVWGVVKKRVLALPIAMGLVGAHTLGDMHSLVNLALEWRYPRLDAS